jgi:hypothetical protein
MTASTLNTPALAALAARFIALVGFHKQWTPICEMPDEDIQTLYDIVVAGGHKITAIEPGRVRDTLNHQGGSEPNGFINDTCRFRVLDHHKRESQPITGWLDCMVQKAIADLAAQSPEEATRRAAEEIIRSNPMKPIRLNEIGYLLGEVSPHATSSRGLRFLISHTRDQHTLEKGGLVGVHLSHYSGVDRKPVSETHDALVCQGCHFHLPFPLHIATYGELRAFFERGETPIHRSASATATSAPGA